MEINGLSNNWIIIKPIIIWLPDNEIIYLQDYQRNEIRSSKWPRCLQFSCSNTFRCPTPKIENMEPIFLRFSYENFRRIRQKYWSKSCVEVANTPSALPQLHRCLTKHCKAPHFSTWDRWSPAFWHVRKNWEKLTISFRNMACQKIVVAVKPLVDHCRLMVRECAWKNRRDFLSFSQLGSHSWYLLCLKGL